MVRLADRLCFPNPGFLYVSTTDMGGGGRQCFAVGLPWHWRMLSIILGLYLRDANSTHASTQVLTTKVSPAIAKRLGGVKGQNHSPSKTTILVLTASD